ncbi:CU044_5270 family protein [Streptomyces cavernae]|uniref:CU044_5270 family protein n=1 Tax=Streptomyces cavernae TaxID=2259034 RepID=UPI000FEBB816|nr:CU044_5270 family protein [Streptomyces cavernae]
MNADKLPSAGRGPSEAEELLAAPAEWDLPPSRHLHFKDVLMQQIDRDCAPAQTPARTPAQATSPAVSPMPSSPTLEAPAPRRVRLPRPAVWLPVASAALAGALAVTYSLDGHSSAPATGTSTGTSTGAATGASGVNSASVTLGRIAAAAMATDTKPVKDDQFVYVRSLTRMNQGTFDGPVQLGPLHTREVWMSQVSTPVSAGIGWIRESGKGAVMPGQEVPVDSADAVPAGIDRPTYEWLSSLPTDPDDLLRLLYARTTVDEGESKDQAVYGKIGDLLRETVMPPANAAALYKAVARIPGVTEIADAVDAAGRHGIGITREDAASATRDEWIFDRKSLAYLGSRSYITKDKRKGARPDTLFGIDAVMQRAVVDRHGEEPTSTRATPSSA